MALSTLEEAVAATPPAADGTRPVTEATLVEALGRARYAYDRQGEDHYNLASALIKSVRNSDASAALYWLARMIEGGADPIFIARRLCILASEDVGLADPQAIVQAAAAAQITHLIGLPEALFPAGAGHDLPGASPEVEPGQERLPGGRRRCRRLGARAGAAPPPQRRHLADERRRLRPRLPLRSRRPRRPARDALPARTVPGPRLSSTGLRCEQFCRQGARARLIHSFIGFFESSLRFILRAGSHDEIILEVRSPSRRVAGDRLDPSSRPGFPPTPGIISPSSSPSSSP